jgi:hypothetical protein
MIYYVLYVIYRIIYNILCVTCCGNPGEIDFSDSEKAEVLTKVVKLISNAVDVRRPGKPFIKSHSQTAGCFNPYDWLPEQ